MRASIHGPSASAVPACLPSTPLHSPSLHDRQYARPPAAPSCAPPIAYAPRRPRVAPARRRYLAHFAQYLSQRNFVDDVSEDLNSLQDDQPPPAQSEWAADFDSGFDSAFEQSASANDASSAPAETFGAEPFGAGGAPPAPTAFDADFDAAFDDAPATASSTAGRPGEEDGDLGV